MWSRSLLSSRACDRSRAHARTHRIAHGPRCANRDEPDSRTVNPQRRRLPAVHDVLVIGAGSAGCVLASRLSEKRERNVVLVEAGASSRKLEVKIPAAFSKLYGSKVDWGYRTTPQAALDGRSLVYPRGRLVGGSAAINAMMALRGHRLDHA